MVLLRAAITQTKLDLAIIACALEHHRLIAGNYPQSLKDLSPKYLKKCPHEVFTGKAYIYQKLDQKIGSFHLYSVGEDMKDSGANKKTDIVWGSQ